MLKGAMQELCMGNPDRLATDVGPVIDRDAAFSIESYIDAKTTSSNSVFRLAIPEANQHGTFVAPTLLEISSLSELTREVFGPVLHVLRFKRDALLQLVDSINATSYGLTLGIHSRINETIELLVARAHVGNIYVNRNIIGAVVGVQPFGGENKSGTGPKAGGPLYLKRLQRNPLIELKNKASGKILPVSPELRSFSQWISKGQHSYLSSLIDRYIQSSILGLQITLPGVTGEENSLSFYPRGKVLCMASTIPAVLNQIAALLSTGNTPVMPRNTFELLPADFPNSVKSIIDCVEILDEIAEDIQTALVEQELLAATRPVLAERAGALISFIETTAHLEIPIWRLVVERALCINTAAAGGNARLMSHSA
jgi:RHH-type proline utilization regulon transcriptional repressor/proline dehydrogenase/delta 1-pyrroline-5-carboxylate dehydrogenase